MVVDWKRDQFELSQAVFSDPIPKPEIITIQPSRNVTNATNSQQDSSKMSSGSIVGVVLGVILVLAASVGGWWIWRRKHKQEKQNKHSNTIYIPQNRGEQRLAELPHQARTEVDGACNSRSEMWVPPKPYKMGTLDGENADLEIWTAPISYEMGVTCGKYVGVYRPDPDLMRKR